MFYHLLFPLKKYISGFNLFQYITFRAAMAAITALVISFIIGPIILRLLKKHQVGEIIRENGPTSHLAKKGTPTMGGIIILFSVIIPVLLWANLKNIYTILILIATIWMGIIGFVDDYLKVVKKIKKGLIARYKLIGQISLGIIIGCYLFFTPELTSLRGLISIPFFKNLELNLGFLLFYLSPLPQIQLISPMGWMV